MDRIRIRGAREHNLKNLSLDIPRDALVVLTGVSGSGKSSLAFDTLYAEGQRRYVESLSAYARQFLGQMEKPDVDQIEGLSPAISIEQRTAGQNPRSTVATVTEIYDYLRLLYARVGVQHCLNCGRPIRGQTVQEMVDHILADRPGARLQVLAPVVRGRKGEYRKEFAEYRKLGFVRARVDGAWRELEEEIVLDKKRKHTVEIVVDRLQADPAHRSRLHESLEAATRLAEGTALLLHADGDEELLSRLAVEQARITHNHPLSDAACVSLGMTIQRGLLGLSRRELQAGVEELAARYPEFRLEGYDGKSSGYVVDTLRTVYDAFLSTDNFEECVVKTVNRGGDADTTGSIAGTIAGARYGLAAIPLRWLQALDPNLREELSALGEELVRMSPLFLGTSPR